MTRNTAREIASHLIYELSFTDLGVEEFLDARLSAENFADLLPECELYEELPNEKQAAYIRRLVTGVSQHAAELDTYIEKYAQGCTTTRRRPSSSTASWAASSGKRSRSNREGRALALPFSHVGRWMTRRSNL